MNEYVCCQLFWLQSMPRKLMTDMVHRDFLHGIIMFSVSQNYMHIFLCLYSRKHHALHEHTNIITIKFTINYMTDVFLSVTDVNLKLETAAKLEFLSDYR